MKKNVLIVDDDPVAQEALGCIIDKDIIEIYKADSFNSASLILNNHDIDIVVCDILLHNADLEDPYNGLSLLEYIRTHFKNTHVIMLSSSDKGILLAKSMHADEAFLKGDDLQIINILIEAYLGIKHNVS